MQNSLDIGTYVGVEQFSGNDKGNIQVLIKVSVPQGVFASPYRHVSGEITFP